MKFFPRKAPYEQKLAKRFNVSRRRTLMALGFAAMMAGVPDKALAFLFAGGAPQAAPPSGSLITSIGVRNLAGSTQTNSIIRHGMLFEQGELPAGQTAVHAPSGSTTPLTNSNLFALNTWPDGSVRQAVMAAQIPSLGTGTVTDPRGNSIAGTKLDIIKVAGQSVAPGISRATTLAYMTANTATATANWVGVDINGITWTADALTALNGSTSWSMTAASYRGAFYTGAFMDCFCATMPLMSGATPHPILMARFWIFVYHSGNTVLDICTDAIIENGVLGIGNPTIGVNNGDYFFADLTLYQGMAQTTVAWQRLAEIPDNTLNLTLGRVSTLPASQSNGAYITGGGTFAFQQRHVGRILESQGQLAYIFRAGATGFATVTSPGSGYTSSSAVTNSGGTATCSAIVDPATGGLLGINIYDGPISGNQLSTMGTLGTLSVSVGTGAVISKNTTASNACLLPAPCIVGSVCRSQSTAGGTLTITGNAAYGGVAYPGRWGGSCFLYSANDNSALTLTVAGTLHGSTTPTTQNFTGPAAGKFVNIGAWDKITAVTYTGGTPSNIALGSGGLDCPTNAVSNKGGNVTFGGSVAPGNWRILGCHIPNHNALHQRTWMNGTPRNYVSFDSTYLLRTKVFSKYAVDDVTKSDYIAAASADIAILNNWPKGSSTNFPDSVDYNPFYSAGNATINGQVFGFTIFESQSGAAPGLSSDSDYDVEWLVCQTYDAWRNTYERARFNCMYSPMFLRDETTGMCPDMATYPNCGTAGTGNTRPLLYTTVSQASGFDGFVGGLSAGFNWYNIDGAHQNTRFRMAAVMSGDPFLLEGLQLEAFMRWTANFASWGLGYDRPATPNGGLQVRWTAWNLKSPSQAWIHHNENADPGVIAPMSIFQTYTTRMLTNPSKGTGLDDWYSSAAAGNNPVGFNKANYGDFHWLVGGDFSTLSSSQTFQTNYLMSTIGGIVSNGKANAAMLNFINWYGQTVIDNILDTNDINPRWQYKAIDVPYGDFCAGTLFSNRSEILPVYLKYFPSPMADYTVAYAKPNTSLTLSAVSGSAVTATTGSGVFYSDMVGCYIADTLYSVSNVQTSSPWTVTMSAAHPFTNGMAVQATPQNRPAGLGNPAMASPLAFGTTYYVGNVTSTTFELFTDAGLTTRVQFTAANSGTYFFAGLAQITAVTQSGVNPVTTCTLNVLRPFVATSIPSNSSGRSWQISPPPAGPNVPGTAFMAGTSANQNSGDIRGYYFDVLGALAMFALHPSLETNAKLAWDTLWQWGINTSYVLNDYATNSGNLSVTFRYH